MKTLIALLAAVWLSGCATSAALRDPDVREFARADVERARDIATAAGDTVAQHCWETLLPYAAADSPLSLEAVGVASEFQRLRTLRIRSDRGVPEDVHIACAPLVVDAQRTLLTIGFRFLK